MTASNVRKSFLVTSSIRSSMESEVYQGSFDVLIAASSWDYRSIVVTRSAELSATHGLLFHFKKKDSRGVSADNEQKLSSFFERHCSRPRILEVEAAEVRHNWTLIRDVILTAYKQTRQPLTIFVDLTTIPRYLSLGVLGYGVQYGLIGKIVYGYSEGRYPSDSRYQGEELFTEGGWNAVPVPGLEGEWEPYGKRHYVVSIGFEGTKTRQFVSRSEPDKVSILFPDPPVEPGYDNLTFENNRELIQQYSVPDSRIVRAHAADVVGALEGLEAARLEDFQSENCLYVCCGTKPQSLALAIRAALLGQPSVLYIVPESHRASFTEPNGTYWKYTIEDLSSL